MDSHKKVLAILYIVMGSFQVVMLLFLAFFLSSFLPWIADEAHLHQHEYTLFKLLSTFIPIFFFALIILFAIPSIVGGVGLLHGRKWALTLLLILGCFKLLSFPIGTALGVYTIWIYAEDNKPKDQSKTNVQA